MTIGWRTENPAVQVLPCCWPGGAIHQYFWRLEDPILEEGMCSGSSITCKMLRVMKLRFTCCIHKQNVVLAPEAHGRCPLCCRCVPSYKPSAPTSILLLNTHHDPRQPSTASPPSRLAATPFDILHLPLIFTTPPQRLRIGKRAAIHRCLAITYSP